MLLEVESVSAGYAGLTVVREASLHVSAGEIVGVVGSNGVGKTTLMRALTGSIRPTGGAVRFDGRDITSVPQNALSGLGLGYVPQEGNVFGDLTVADNLLVSCRGSLTAARARCEKLLTRFPRLEERRQQAASTLSGGERQMLAIACALVAEPALLVLDEPTTGLAPLIVRERIRDIEALRDGGAGVLWVIEEHPRICLPAVDRVYHMSEGRLSDPRPAAELLADGALETLFFGART